MAVQTVVKTIGTTGVYSTPQLHEDGAPGNYTTAEKSSAGTFAVASFSQGETITFVGSGATGKFLDTDSTGPGTGTYILYGLVTGNVATSDVATGGTSGATCIVSSGTPTDTGVIWQGQLQNQEFSGTGVQLAVGGGTNSSTAYYHLTTVTGASFRDHASVQSNALKYDATLGAAIRGTSANTYTVNLADQGRITGVQVTATGAGGRAILFEENNNVAQFCIFEGRYVGTNVAIGIIAWNGTTTATVKDCLIVERASAADHLIGTGTASPSFYNCTIVAPDDLATAPVSIFLSGASGTVTVQNCGLFAGGDSPTAAGSATFNFTTCHGDDSTPAAGITTATFSSQFQNVNDATRDFRLVTGADMKDTGTTDTTNAPIDIAGTARPSGSAYDGGCWELVQAAGGTYPGADGCGAW
jgi:hypothetical protein